MSGWQTANLGDVCNVRRGSVITKKKANPGDVPVIAGGIGPAYYHDTPNRDANVITVSGSGANAGFVNFFDRPIWASDCSTVQPIGEELDVRYVYLFLLSMQEFINENLRQGAAQPHVYPKDLSKLDIPLPPLEEQKRIVTVLDQVFAALDSARANAVANLADAREILSSQLAKRFLVGGVNWVERKIGDLCNLITDGKHGDCANQVDSGYYFLSAKDVRNGALNYEGSRQITFADFQETHRRTDLSAGDVLVTNAGTIGRTAIAREDPKTERTTFQKSVAVLKPKREVIDSAFLELGLRANLVNLQKLSAGAAQKNLLLRDLRSFLVRMPERIEEQRKVAEDFAHFEAKIGVLEKELLSETQDLDDLWQSILQRAFAGELT